ncbi:MAG: hypothetical protein ACXV8L_16715, partial [Ilumatobacteraceae bacterium]
MPGGHLRQRGLVETGASGHVVFDCGGDGYSLVTAANVRQLYEGFLGLGIAPEDIDHYLELLA